MSHRAVRRTPMPLQPAARRPLDRSLVFVSALVALKLAVLACMLVWVIWPGWVVHAAPLACPPGFPDAFAMEHSVGLPGSQRTTWKLVCMSQHGALFLSRSMLPMLLAVAALWPLCMVLALPAVRWVREYG